MLTIPLPYFLLQFHFRSLNQRTMCELLTNNQFSFTFHYYFLRHQTPFFMPNKQQQQPKIAIAQKTLLWLFNVIILQSKEYVSKIVFHFLFILPKLFDTFLWNKKREEKKVEIITQNSNPTHTRIIWNVINHLFNKEYGQTKIK